MVVYNVTVKVVPEVHAEWLNWMQHSHIPEVMKTGLFLDNRICRLLDQDESEGITYAIQYTCRTVADYELYARDHGPKLRHQHNERYPGHVSFRTLMEVI